MEILPEKHSRINNRINLFEEIFLRNCFEFIVR